MAGLRVIITAMLMTPSFFNSRFGVVFILFLSVSLFSSCKPSEEKTYKQYADFFEKVYQTMEENYYQPIDHQAYEHFLQQFQEKIYAQLKQEGKSVDYVRWRSAAILVENLRSAEDIFSAFYPPAPAKQYEKTALGKKVDLGIEGQLIPSGFVTTQVEPRSDAYEEGLRISDLIVQVNDQEIASLDEDKIKDLLNPLIDTSVRLTYVDAKQKVKHEINVVSKEYFKQTVFMKPVPVPGIYCLEVQRFNKNTAEDILRFLVYIRGHDALKGLILDLRNNPGGPPLAARELSSFFLPGGEDLAYFQKRGQPKAMLDVPVIPQEYKFEGPMVILVNKDSGSASELFSGVMQRRHRAVLMGTNTAGQVMLKSMFNLDDGSMVLLLTARGQHPDGSTFSFRGVQPDRYVDENEQDEILKYAAGYLWYVYEHGCDKDPDHCPGIQ